MENEGIWRENGLHHCFVINEKREHTHIYIYFHTFFLLALCIMM